MLTNSYQGFNKDIECPLSLQNTPQSPKIQIQDEKFQQRSTVRKQLYKELDEKFKKCEKFKVMADVHKSPKDKSSTAFISVPNNARQVGTPEMLQKILGNEINSIISEKSSIEIDSSDAAVKYVFIKPWNERCDKNSLAEAIVYTGSKECLF